MKIKNLGISCFVAGAMILGGLSFFQPAKVYAEDLLPQSFEYRIADIGLTVGDQGGTQLCWAYTSSKVLETLIYNATSQTAVVNISEDWISLAYQYYVNDENQTLISEGKTTDDKTTYLYGQTGIPQFFQRVIMAYGLMFEENFVLTESITTENYKQIFEASKEHVNKNLITNIQPLWAGKIDNYVTQDDIVYTIKNYLYNFGALYTAVNGSAIATVGEYAYVYHLPTEQLTHAMTIIGFDDAIQIDVNGDVKTGAFKLLNSYGNYRQIVYMPYDMMAPNIVEIDDIPTETNAVLSNTFVFNVEFNTGDNPGGNDTPTNPNQPTNPDEPENPADPNEPTDPNQPVDPNPDTPTDPDEPVDPNPNEPTNPEDPDDPNEPTDPSPPVVPDDPNDGPNDPNEDISGGGGGSTTTGQNTMGELLDNLLGRYEQKSGGEKAVVVFAILTMLGLAGTGIGFGIATLITKSKTAAINQSAFGNSVQQYRQHQLSLAQQKADLEKQIADMRAEAKKRKQRRLKREFKKKLEENQ